MHGRCASCRQITPAAVWNAYQEQRKAFDGISLEAFQPTPALRPPLVSRLLPVEEAERILAKAQAAIDACEVRRVEQIGPRAILERAQDMKTGEQIMRLTMRVAAQEEVNG